MRQYVKAIEEFFLLRVPFMNLSVLYCVQVVKSFKVAWHMWHTYGEYLVKHDSKTPSMKKRRY